MDNQTKDLKINERKKESKLFEKTKSKDCM